MIHKTQRLNNRREIPTTGLGTWGLADENILENSIRNAIDLGYRHIDTAFIYGNEKMIGNVLRRIFNENVITREELFITSKLWNTCHRSASNALRQSLEDLQLDYLDLYLIHWPVSFEPDPNGTVVFGNGRYRPLQFDPVALWKEMETFVDLKLARSIGISNFGIVNTKRVLESCRIRPAVSQFEFHPYLTQKELVSFLKSESIQVISYSSLGSSSESSLKVREDKTIASIAKKYRCSSSQVILSYITMQGICVIPKSSSRAHLEENITMIELEEDDFNTIDNLGITHRYVDPVSFGPSRFE